MLRVYMSALPLVTCLDPTLSPPTGCWCSWLVLHKVALCLGLEAGLFKWSMRHQDGTQPPEAARELTEEDRHFLELAMEEYTQARPAFASCCPQQEPTPLFSSASHSCCPCKSVTLSVKHTNCVCRRQ